MNPFSFSSSCSPGHAPSPSSSTCPPSHDTMDSISSHSTPSSIPSDSAHGSDPAIDSTPVPFVHHNNAYYSYDGRSPAQALSPEALSIIYYSPSLMLSDGALELSDLDVDLHRPMDGTHGCLKALTQLRQQHSGLRVLLSIGSRDFFRQVAQTGERRQRFAASARAFIDTHELDGIDIDWQFPSDAREGQDQQKLLKELRQAMPAGRYWLTTALPPTPNPYVYGSSGVRRLAQSVDFCNLAAFDFAYNGGWAVHQAQLYTPPHAHGIRQLSVLTATSELCKLGVPPHKILVGIPVYGRRFLEAFGGEHLDMDQRRRIASDKIPYRDLPPAGYGKTMLHRAVGGAYCASADGGWISFDNPDSVGMKCDLIKLNRLGGLYFRDAVFDTPDEAGSLVWAGYNNLNVQ